jgi:hypothetical protein
MNTVFRKVGMGATALMLAGVLGGCNNGSGGGGLIRLFFGINGSGNCTSIIVDVNLDDADAVIARDESGDVQCTLNTTLDNAGCDIDFQELEGGDLRATISGCTIPAVTNLFSCLFEDVDISELQETASAQCSCVTQGCDGTPPVCISTDPDPTSCEDCDNGIDDDGNGLEDCEDPNCQNFPGCEGSTTTTVTSTTEFDTTTTTNSTTTTVTSTTSTTLGGFPCTIVFRLDDDVTLGSLQYETDYSDAPGEFLGTGGNVECASLIQGALAAFNDVEDQQSLDSGIISLTGFTGPVNVAECTFTANSTPEEADFAITVIEASDPDLNTVEPLPDVSIQSIECDVVTTTLGPTTTTTGGPTTTTVPTTTVAGPEDYNVAFTLTSATASAGALQFTADYEAALGEFAGTAALVSCTNQASGALFAPNDVDAEQELTLGFIALTPIPSGSALATCVFNGDSSDAPVPGDFVITIDDATDSNGEPITVTIGVTVTPVP